MYSIVNFFHKSLLILTAALGVINPTASYSQQEAQELNYTPVEMPNGSKLPYVMEDGVKVFHLIAEPVKQEFAPGLIVNCWGYNGSSPGPMIEAVEGDRVRILVTNKLPAPTSVHWHGLLLPSGMDGVSGLSQRPIPPGETFKYEFTLKQHGTYMYHSHFDEMIQMGMGMMGFFIIHPKNAESPKVDRDFAIFLHEWYLPPGATTPDPTVMLDFNYFTFNGKVAPAVDSLVVRKDQRVRIRLANLSMDNHPIHLHGFFFKITGTGGSRVPSAVQQEDVTVDVPVGTTRDIEFIADVPGDWAFHCHKTHHVMSGMEHGLPNLLGVSQKEEEKELRKLLPMYMGMGEAGMGSMASMGGPKNTLPMTFPGPFSKIEMGGMFTVVKVREDITDYTDPGWYKNPEGTVAKPVDSHKETEVKQGASHANH
jgi:FtsP/CotA-like multicopper oxidase with cupredoxin domain